VQAFTGTTGKTIQHRMMQGLLKVYSAEEILEAIMLMGNREVEKPYSYMRGILKKKRTKRLAVNGRNGRDAIGNAVKMLTSEASREDRPKLRSPFNGATLQP